MEQHAVEAALAAALQRHGGQAGEVQGLQRLSGGATKQTWAFDWSAGGQRRALILQRSDAQAAAPGQPPRLSAPQDAAMMNAARRGGVAAPVVQLVLAPEDGLGAGYITERVEGDTLGRTLVHDERLAGARRVLAAQCGATLAAIHALPTTGLPFLARLSPAQELAAYAGLLAGYDLAQPALAYALRWVRQHLPAPGREAVVHADFRSGNLIVGPEGLRCVLDWEIARIGDPMQDLGVLCMRTWRFGGAGEVGGFGARAALYAAYEAAGGCVVDPQRVRFWEAFANLKWAIACVRRGLATRADGGPASLELAAIGRRLEEPLWDFFSLIEQPV
jgi:aminoglycoside phosphotransferase (APT) family kinase protein